MHIHPSEEHELTLSSATRTLRSPSGEAIGQVPRIFPGTAQEREALDLIDLGRLDAEARDRHQRPGERRRRLRRYWGTRMRHEA